MAKLQNYNGRYCEQEFEYAFLSYLEAEGWHYLSGNSISRPSRREVLYADDLEQFLCKTNPDLTADEVRQIMDNVRLVGSESDFATLHKVYGWMVNGVQFKPKNGLAKMKKKNFNNHYISQKDLVFRTIYIYNEERSK